MGTEVSRGKFSTDSTTDPPDSVGMHDLWNHLQDRAQPTAGPWPNRPFEKPLNPLNQTTAFTKASTRQPAELRETAWLKGKLAAQRVRCQSACGYVSQSICWLFPTGQKANVCFVETKHFHFKAFTDEINHHLKGSFLPLELLGLQPPVSSGTTPLRPACWQSLVCYVRCSDFTMMLRSSKMGLECISTLLTCTNNCSL